MAYAYSPLDVGRTRIIEVHAIDPEIQIRLVDYSDDHLPDFFALSYTWGTEENTDLIQCDDHGAWREFPVTPHLKDGLLSILRAFGLRNLWVDAICIDQESETEKEAQVAKMHQIYQKAKGVYVWLGAEAENSTDVIAAMNSIRLGDMPELEEGFEALSAALLQHKSRATRLFTMDLFKPVAALSRRPWFRRLWIAQEYLFAQNVDFVCGKSVISGSHFIRVLQKLTINAFGDHQPPNLEDEEELFVGYTTVRELETIKTNYAQSTKPIFYEFVMLNRDRFGKEPVDRIYAAFGMATGPDDIYRRGIPIDYSEQAKSDFWRLYATFGKIALVHEPHLRLLSQVSSRERPDELPSWCPNLNSTMITSELDSTRVYASGWPYRDHEQIVGTPGSGLRPCSGHPNFKGQFENHATTDPESNIVSIWGACLGQIAAIGVACDWNADVDLDSLESLEPFARGFLKWLGGNEKFYKHHCANEATAARVSKSMLVASTSESRRIQKDLPDVSEKDMASSPSETLANATRPEHSTGEAQNDSPTEVVKDQPDTERDDGKDRVLLFMISVLLDVINAAEDENIQKLTANQARDLEAVYTWIMFLHESWHNRIPYVTDTGHFGFASDDVKPGDRVCMLYGGRSLYVLRESAECHIFVSDSYVMECVNGEVFEMLDAGTVQEELFDIA